MNSLDKFRSKVSAKQTELILRKLVKKQENGEIRSDEELRKELTAQIGAVTGGGLITLEIPVLPWNMVESERFKTFFEDLGMDIEVLFVEVDNTEEILAGFANNIESHQRGLQFEIGNLRSEIIRRRLRRPPGSGWSTIQRDSFDSGYSKLLDRAELSIDLFYDDRTGPRIGAYKSSFSEYLGGFNGLFDILNIGIINRVYFCNKIAGFFLRFFCLCYFFLFFCNYGSGGYADYISFHCF